MTETKRGMCAVIFTSRRTADDPAGYAAASAAMADEASRQPGFVGMNSVRDAAGDGITISYWQTEADAVGWRKHAEHSIVRERGRALWYDHYEVVVATVSRDYRWCSKAKKKADPEGPAVKV